MIKQMAGTTAILLFAANLTCGIASADDQLRVDAQELAEITNDRNSDINDLYILVGSDGLVQGIRFDTRDPSGDQAGQAATTDFSLSQLEAPSGAVLVSEQGYDAVILNGDIDSAGGVGTFTVRYLTDALLDSYAECPAQLKRNAQQQWQLLNSTTGAVITQLRIKSWSMGITTIEGLCASGDSSQ